MGNLGWMNDWYGVSGSTSSNSVLRRDGTWGTVGTGTIGTDYVDSVSSGANIAVSGTPGAPWTPTVALSTAIAVTRLTVSGNSTLGAVNQGNSTAANLSVAGGSTVGTMQAGASTHTSLSVSGGSTLGTVTAGASSLASLHVTGGSSHAGAAVFTGGLQSSNSTFTRKIVLGANGYFTGGHPTYGHTFNNIADDANNVIMYDNGNVAIRGVTLASTSGIHIPDGVAAVSTYTLYNDGGTLKWNGITVETGGASVSGTSGTICRFTGSSDVGDAIITQQGTTGVTVTGSAKVTNGLTVSSGTLAVSSGAVFGRTVFVPAGTNTLSAAVSSMANGTCLLLDASTYTQTERIKIPSSVTTFSILGRGSAVTKLKYTANVEALTSTLSGVNTHRIRQCRLDGLHFLYSNASSCSYDGITLWGSGSFNSTAPGTLDRNIVIHDVTMTYDNQAASVGPAWQNDIRLVDARMAYLDKIVIRNWSNSYGAWSATPGDAIRLESCMDARVSDFYILCSSKGVNLVRASSQYVLEHTAGSGVHHGCEGCEIRSGTIAISETAISLGYKSFAANIHDVGIVTPETFGIHEDISSGADAGGYHTISNMYFDTFTGNGTLVWLRRPGTVMKGSVLHILNSSCTGVIIDADASLCDISHNLFRAGGTGGRSGIYINSSQNMVVGNRFQAWVASGADVALGSSAHDCLVTNNLIDYAISNAGSSNSTTGNLYH